MNPLLRPRSLLACAMLVLAAAGFLAPPASAARPVVTITRPGDDQALGLSAFPVEAVASMEKGVLVGKIVVTVAPLDTGSKQPSRTAEFEANGRDEQSVSSLFQVDYNGSYRATVTATGTDQPVDLDGPEQATRTRDFSVVAPPAPPANVRLVLDKESRAVTLSWNANTEKDMLFYVVHRAKGDGPFSEIAKTEGPGDTSIVDPSTAEAAGDYRYRVVAVRRGAAPNKEVNSGPSREATASVPGPPGGAATTPADTTPAGPGAPAGGAGPSGTTASSVPADNPDALKKSGGIDLSGFSSIKNQARRPAPPPPDPGFNQALPFDTTNTTRLLNEDDRADEGSATSEIAGARELGTDEARDDRQRSAAFLAAGLLATVLLMHLLWIKGEVQREPLEAVVPE